ncbi:MAG: MgtC/SapB family protein [Chloroflexi bacterium]|nr:MgtC/SapB family protein [Chloroflexota bacterium]
MAALGLAVGCGLYLVAVVTAVLILVALRLKTPWRHD